MARLSAVLRRHPAWVLFGFAPVVAELFTGSTPLSEFVWPGAFLPLMMLYGSGAILARELALRWRKGWWGLFLLGMAYGIYEEGLVVRSFFDPTWEDLGALAWYGRVGGLNAVWAVHLTLFHAVVSVLATVTLVHLMFPRQRGRFWLSRPRHWAFHLANLALMLPLGQVLNPYDAPDGWVVVCWLSIAALVGMARVWPPPRPVAAAARPVASPWRFFLLGLGGMLVQFLWVSLGAEGGRYPFFVTLGLLILNPGAVWLLARRWSQGWRWRDPHRLALILGGLSFFLLWVPFILGQTYPEMYWSHPLFALALGGLYVWVARREALGRP